LGTDAVADIAIGEGAGVAADVLADTAIEHSASQSGVTGAGQIVVDANVLINAINKGEGAAVDLGLAGRNPLVPITAAKEFLVKGDADALRQWMSQRGGSIAAASSNADIAAFQKEGFLAKAAQGGYSTTDAAIGAAARNARLPVLTRDKDFIRVLKALQIPFETY
jgi:predicted nucleic acid-binding protein